MYTLATAKGASYSFSYNQGRYYSYDVNDMILWLFKGTAPTSFDQIPQEWLTNPVEMAKNSIGMTRLTGNIDLTKLPVTGFKYSNKDTWIHAKGNVFDSDLNRWCLDADVSIYNRMRDGVDGYATNEYDGAFGTNSPAIYENYRKFYLDLAMRDVYTCATHAYHPTRFIDNPGNVKYSNRSAQLYPLVFEFGTVQNIDGFFIKQSSAAYSSAYMDVETWNDETNTWNESFRVQLNDHYQFAILMNFDSVTTSRIRATFSDTGSQDAYPGFFQWVSTQEPADKKDPYDVTWGLISWAGANDSTDFHSLPSLNFKYFENEQTYNQTQGYPYLLVDVGSPNSGKTVILNNATDVVPHDELTVLHLGLDFKDL